MEVNAIYNHIIFKFEREVVRSSTTGRERTQFKEETEWGFDLGEDSQEYDAGAKTAQWGKVIDVGHKVTNVSIGDRILIEPLKWTSGIEVNGTTYWRTDEDCVLCVDESSN